MSRKQPTPCPPEPARQIGDMAMREHFKLLGFTVRDVVTGFTGVVTSVSFDQLPGYPSNPVR